MKIRLQAAAATHLPSIPRAFHAFVRRVYEEGSRRHRRRVGAAGEKVTEKLAKLLLSHV